MVFATLANGALMAAVSSVMLRMPPEELGAFGSLLDVLTQLSIPITGVLAVFMQQTVLATTEEARRELVGTARGIIIGTIGLWLLIALIVAGFQDRILQNLKLQNAVGWWLTLTAGLAALLAPTLTGILQGEQKFFWVGISYMVNGFGRFVGVAVAVLLLHRGTDGAMTGVLLGNLFTLVLVAWQTRWIWTAPSARCEWGPFLRRVIPITLGLAVPTFMFGQDLFVVQKNYELSASAAYTAPRVVGRVLFFLVGPLTAVMFPKIARSAATSENTNVLAQAVGATALVCGGTALACTVFPTLMLKTLSLGKSNYLQTAWLIPYFAWSLMPLALSHLLINNLLARKRFAAVPWLMAVAAGYWIALRYSYWSYLTVIATLGASSLLLFLVCVVFTIRSPRAGATRH